MGDRTRCDIVTATHAIEVDWSKKWAEAIGQSLNYSFQTNLRAGIILIMDTPTDTREAIRVNSIIRHYDLPVTLWVIDKQNEELTLRMASYVPAISEAPSRIASLFLVTEK